jgi:hypothetical protein
MIDILFVQNGTAYSSNCFTYEKELKVSKLQYCMVMLNYCSISFSFVVHIEYKK